MHTVLISVHTKPLKISKIYIASDHTSYYHQIDYTKPINNTINNIYI